MINAPDARARIETKTGSYTSLFKVISYADLKTAYEILEMIEEIDARNGKSQTAVDLKREIRKFTHAPVSERRIIQDDGIDGYTELLPLPARIKSVDEAVSYFEACECKPYYPAAYDCTGQAFTAWYKVFARRGRFWAYHRVSVDV